MQLRFVHGWGFDASLWDGVRGLIGGEADDLGYFGPPFAAEWKGGPVIAVGHSLGAMLLLGAPPRDCVGFVAVNGFDRFAGESADAAAVPRRVVERMIARFRQQPVNVLADFRKRCGEEGAVPAGVETGRLLMGLERLRDADERARSAAMACPVLVLHGSEDQILPPAMRAATFRDARDVERHELPGQGHLLPLTAAEWCASHIRAFAQKLMP